MVKRTAKIAMEGLTRCATNDGSAVPELPQPCPGTIAQVEAGKPVSRSRGKTVKTGDGRHIDRAAMRWHYRFKKASTLLIAPVVMNLGNPTNDEKTLMLCINPP